MTNLTARQIEKLNDTSTIAREVELGNIIQDLISAVNNDATTGTAVNAVNATKTLTISDVVVDGETVTINNPLTAGTDVYEFVADNEQTVTVETNIPVDITLYTTKSHGTLTIDTQPSNGDTMTIGTKVYTFVPNGTDTADGEISIGTDLASAKTKIVAAINGTDSINEPHPLVSASAFATNDCTITALVGGVSGDTIATTETFTAGTNIFGAATLGSGGDCTATNAVTALVYAVTADDTQGVGAVDGAGDTVVLTADVAGVAGNNIVIGEAMANGAFAGGATKLSGGVDGTVGVMGQILVDETYMYQCVADNTISGKNWRRISLGSAF